MTPGNWTIVKNRYCIISDTEDLDGFKDNTGHTDKEYYGGILICESIWKLEDAKIISKAKEMFDIIDSLENDDKTITEAIWNEIQNIKNFIKL